MMYIRVLASTFLFLLCSAIDAAAGQVANFNVSSTKTISTTREAVLATRFNAGNTKNTHRPLKSAKGSMGYIKKSTQQDMNAREAIQQLMPSFNK